MIIHKTDEPSVKEQISIGDELSTEGKAMLIWNAGNGYVIMRKLLSRKELASLHHHLGQLLGWKEMSMINRYRDNIVNNPMFMERYHLAMAWHQMMKELDPESGVTARVQALVDVMQQALWNMDLCLHLLDPDDCPDCRH